MTIPSKSIIRFKAIQSLLDNFHTNRKKDPKTYMEPVRRQMTKAILSKENSTGRITISDSKTHHTDIIIKTARSQNKPGDQGVSV